jgi:uncharacterized membrane protein
VAVSALALAVALVALLLIVRLQREVESLRRMLGDVYRPSRTPAARPSQPAPSPVGPDPPATVDSAPVIVPPQQPAGIRDAAVPPVLPSGPIPSSQTRPSEGPDTIERRIGERALLYAGMLVLVLGIAFFLRYSFERNWMSPPVRVGLGALGGSLLLAGGRRLAGRGFRLYGLFLSGGGLAVLFLSVYAALAFYGLLAPLPAFLLLAAIAAVTAVMADRDASLPLALMAVCGGFATPFLVGGDTDAQAALFSYDALLIAATMYLAQRRGWPWLNLASFVFTVLTVASWAGEYYTGARAQALRTELFLTLYCAMFLVIQRANARATDPHARLVTRLLWCVPVLYHLASIAILHPHGVTLPVYLILASAAIVAASLEAEAPALRALGWLSVILPLTAWTQTHDERSWLAAAVLSATGVWLIFLLAQARLARLGVAFRGWDVAHLHASGVGAFVSLSVALADFVPAWGLAAVAGGLAMANTGLWAWLGPSVPQALHWLGVACSLAIIAVGVGFDGHWAVGMWAAEAAVLVWLGARFDRLWFRRAGLALFFIAAWRWLDAAAPVRDDFVVFLNARALAGGLVIVLLYVAAWRLRPPLGEGDGSEQLERAALLVAASALTVLLLSLEIDGFFAARGDAAGDSELPRQLLLSASWAAYAGLTVAAGMRYGYPPIRYFAIGLFGLTLAKVFLVDIQRLAGIYRVTAFLVVGGILLLASFLYQRARTR